MRPHVGWLALQLRGRPRTLARRLGELVGHRLPSIGPVAMTLAASGYLGRVGASLIPTETVEALVAALGWPDWVLLSVLPALICLLAFTAVSPIMLAVFFGSLFGSLPELPVDATLLALSISCGWALTMMASPFATVALMLARQNDMSAARLTLRWNGPFALGCFALLVVVFYVLTGGR